MQSARVRRLYPQCTFILQGIVEAVGVSDVPGIPPSDRTLTLRVDRVLEAPPDLRPSPGLVVTVLMSKTVTLKPRDFLQVFADAIAYGSTLGLAEVASEGGEPGELDAQVDAARISAESDLIAARLDAADLVVAGEVVALTAVEQAGTTSLSEHHADWWDVTVRVDEVLKGTHRPKTVAWRYPASDDVMWRDVPRPQARQRGVFLLHKGAERTLSTATYTALDPLDIQRTDRRATIASLIAAADGASGDAKGTST